MRHIDLGQWLEDAAAAPVGIAILDKTLLCCTSNATMARLHGLQHGALQGQDLATILPDVAAQLRPKVERVLCGQQLPPFELVVSSGPDRPNVLRASLHANRAKGLAPSVTYMAINIDQEKRAEALLHDLENQHRYALEMSPHVFWTSGPDGKIAEFSPGWATLLSTTRSHALIWQEAVHPEDLGHVESAWQHSIETGDALDIEFRVLRDTGSVLWCRSRASARKNKDGSIVQWHGLVEDIHDRKSVEVALRESEDHYRHAVVLNPQMQWTASRSGKLIDLSPRWREIIDVPPEDTVDEGWVKALHPSDRHSAKRVWASTFTTGYPLDCEFRFRHRSGEYRWYRIRAYPRKDENGEIVLWYGLSEDVSDRKLAEHALRKSERFANAILEASPDCITVLDPEGRLTYMNGPGQHLLEITDFASYKGQPWRKLWPDSQHELMRDHLENLTHTRVARFTTEAQRSSGRKWWDISVCAMRNELSANSGTLIIARDVTDAYESRQELVQARAAVTSMAERLESVLESTTDNVVLLDQNLCITYANGRASKSYGCRGLVPGNSFHNAFGGESDELRSHLVRAITGASPAQFEIFVTTLGAWLEMHAFPADEGLSVYFRDVSVRHKAEQDRRHARMQLLYMERHDTLTGLLNRSAFSDRLTHILASTPRDSAVAILNVDLDYFKMVNDALGHSVGDNVLNSIAARMGGCIREEDQVARIGGDEFAISVVMPRRSDELEKLAHRLIRAISEPFHIDGHEFTIGASVGIARASGQLKCAESLLRFANIALQHAKASGRQCVREFDPEMDAMMHFQHDLRAGLRKAMQKNELEMHYQPLVDIKSGRVTSFEALLRWRSEARGLVSPSDFIPIAEETGLIDPIGQWVLREACQEAMGWPSEICVSVNLSPVQFNNGTLVDTVAQILKESGLAPERLELEITESVLLQQNQRNLDMLLGLKALGVRISLDDFGTGYSELSYLRVFPFDTVKIDRSFTSDLPHQQAKAIVLSIIQLCNRLGISTTAEGVETWQQFGILRSNGCDTAQGFLFSKPVPVTEVLSVIDLLNGSAQAAICQAEIVASLG